MRSKLKQSAKAVAKKPRKRTVTELLVEAAVRDHYRVMGILNENPANFSVHYAAIQALSDTVGYLLSIHTLPKKRAGGKG